MWPFQVIFVIRSNSCHNVITQISLYLILSVKDITLQNHRHHGKELAKEHLLGQNFQINKELMLQVNSGSWLSPVSQ